MFIELTEDKLQEIVSQNENVIVQYSASWCGNCRMMKPKFKRFGNESEATYVLIDAELNPESRKLANVTNLPTFAVFKNGEFVDQIQTNKSENLKLFINEVAGN